MNELMNEGMKDMKRIVMIIMAAVLVALPTMAQQQEWKSTSAMQTSGSNYAPQINAVGAAAVEEMATTTESYSPAQAPGGPRRVLPGGTNEPGQSADSPIGDAVLPLMLFAGAFLCMRVFLRRKRALSR